MAGRIAGITVEIGGNTTKLQTALKGVDNQLKATQNNLKDINRLLKLDPKNTELLTQKQKNLENAIKQTKERLNELKNAQSQVKEGTAEWDALQREIIDTEQKLKSLEKEYKNFGSVQKQQLIAAGEQMKELGNKVTAVGQTLRPLSVAAGAVAGGMVALAVSAASGADDLNTLSKQTGLTTAEIQKMQYAADRIDVPFDSITGALRKMKPKMQESNAAFQRLGVSVVDAEGNVRQATDVFYDAIEALSRIPNETERDQVAMELFGKTADELAGVVDDGGRALREYGDEAERLNLILGQDTLDAINATNDALDKAKAQLNASKMILGSIIAEGLTPLINNLALIVEKIAVWLQRLTPEQTNLVLGIAATVAAIAPLLIVGGKLITMFGMLMIAAPGFAAALAGAAGPILGLVAVIGVLVAAGIWLENNWEWLKEKAQEVWQNILDGFKDFTNKLTTSLKTFGNAAKQSISNTWNSAKTVTVNAWNNMVNGVISRANALRTGVSNIFNSVVASVQNMVSRCQSLMNFSWHLPHLALPHLSVTGTFSLRPPSVPHFSIAWYKKAYDNPLMFTRPTVLQTPQGLKGFGDGHGGEVVLGMNRLRELVDGAGDTITINVYANEGMNVNQLADAIQNRLVQLSRQKEAAYA